MAVVLVALTDHLSLQKFQSGKKRRGPIALVVVGHRAAASLFQGQAGLGAVQRLNLALLIDAQHDGLLGWIEVEPDHVGQLLQKPQIPS